MIEFGSNFHYINFKNKGNSLFNNNYEKRYFADGRLALKALIIDQIINNNWKCLWVPEYFCYHVIESIRSTGIELKFYPDYPLADDISLINSLSFNEGDVILRVNYFGVRGFRDNSKINIPVIEDHSHDLISDWALKSNADYCFASLRKTIPIPNGGILWSPLNHTLPAQLDSTKENEIITYQKLCAMLLKKIYLEEQSISKDIYRCLFRESEESLNIMELSGISLFVKKMIENINIEDFYKKGKNNWNLIYEDLKHIFNILKPEESCNNFTPFSIILIFDNIIQRNQFREKLIENNIYPVILWEIPEGHTEIVNKFSNNMLSLYCDGRFSKRDIRQMIKKIKSLVI